MADKYYVYRPLLDMIGHSEGTVDHDGYNETLGYGRYTGGNVKLVDMTIDEVDALQTKMLAHPENKWDSSAAGMYQIVRTTLREIKKTLKLSGKELWNADMQDRMACFLLGKRGIDTYLDGKMTEDQLILNLSKEWASLPTPNNRGYYDGQHARVDVDFVRDVLAEVRARHAQKGKNQPSKPEVPPTQPVVSEAAPLWIGIPVALGIGAISLLAYMFGG